MHSGGTYNITSRAPDVQAVHQAAPVPDWVPSWKDYEKRRLRRVNDGNLRQTPPEGFPSSVDGAACWKGSELPTYEYVQELTPHNVIEIESALASFKAGGFDLDALSPTTFPLPSLSSKLSGLAETVHNGCGLAILRGLDPTKYNSRDNVIIYAGISSYIGSTRGRQDTAGNVLVHVKDVGDAVAPSDARQSPYANVAQPFHTDLGDIIAMYCIDKAATGGKSRLASAAYIYNDIVSTRPDLICDLATDNWAFDTHRTDPPEYYTRPILFHQKAVQETANTKDRVYFCFSRRQLTGSQVAPRPANFPILTDAQAEALDAVHFTAERNALEIQLHKGDLQFINNLAVLHAREAFTDADTVTDESNTVTGQRHLIRMWLRNENLAIKTPNSLQSNWDEIYGATGPMVWHLDANHSRAHVINRRYSCYG